MLQPVNAALDLASKTTLSQYWLRTDPLSRMIVATLDAGAHGIPMHSKFSLATQMHGPSEIAKIVGAPNDSSRAFFAQHQAAIQKQMMLPQ